MRFESLYNLEYGLKVVAFIQSIVLEFKSVKQSRVNAHNCRELFVKQQMCKC